MGVASGKWGVGIMSGQAVKFPLSKTVYSFHWERIFNFVVWKQQ